MAHDTYGNHWTQTLVTFLGQTWIPWQDRDMRSFGFVTFRNVEDAVKVVAASPHAIGDAQVNSTYKRQSRNDQANKGLTGKDVLDSLPSVGSFLERLPAKDLSRSDGKHYTWDDYLAPDNLKVDLRRIGEDLDSEHLGRNCSTCWRGV